MGFLKLKRALTRLALPLLLSAYSANAAATVEENIALEYQVKAAFVFNFARFVTWPPSAFPLPDSPVLIGCLGQDSFTSALQKTLDGKTVEGRPLVVKTLENADTPVQILVISKSAESRAATILKIVKANPTLTVSESQQFLKQGGMIRLDVEDDKVRFIVNQPAVDQSGLVISSQMLQYASGEK